MESKCRVLIADDDEAMINLLTFMMKREGFDVIVASDGREASRFVNTIDPVNLVVLDQLMPFKSGMLLISEIRSRKNWDDVPIIMLTSKNHETDIVSALDSGADDYLVKPINPKVLMARIKRYINR